jgi:hypothetical protein
MSKNACTPESAKNLDAQVVIARPELDTLCCNLLFSDLCAQHACFGALVLPYLSLTVTFICASLTALLICRLR